MRLIQRVTTLNEPRTSISTFLRSLFTTSAGQPEHYHPPPTPRRSERKPLVKGINELKRRARLHRKTKHEVREIPLNRPENGILVKPFIPLAHQVFDARSELFLYVSKGVWEVHVGTVPHRIRTCDVAGSLPSKEHRWERGGIEHVLAAVETFHLYDRVGRAVSHEERLEVDRIPAIVELCVQAGVDVPEYPTKRRVIPVYNIAGKTVDFERKYPRDFSSGKDIQPYGFWEKKKKREDLQDCNSLNDVDIQGTAIAGMAGWEKLQAGAVKLMSKSAVQTCGFCPEVQVGPKGHRARICRAYKHQMRDGRHAWQEATVDDLLPPIPVWHVPDPRNNGALVDVLRRYYKKLPAVVELFAQAGTSVGGHYDRLMKGDVAVPTLDEEKLAV